MTSSPHFKKFAAIAGAAAAVALSSCTLPPEQAWRKIRTDGLIAYWSYELGSQHAESHLKHAIQPAPSMLVAQSQPHISPTTHPGMTSSGSVLTAMSIPALPGFVRSPYTNPPRLVDVKGAVPGSTMICPYTQRPFVVPQDYVNPPGTSIADTSAPSQPNISIYSPEPEPKRNVESLPKVVVNNNRSSEPAPSPPVEKPKSKPASNPAPVASESPKPSTSSVNPPAPPAVAPKPVQEIPFGSAIPGRPGFVNSPFAAKHQLVDVTGLPAGMEVKCPYTGKLFRVPPQDVASSKPAESAPLASPEEPKKK